MSTPWKTYTKWESTNLLYHCDKTLEIYTDRYTNNACLHLCFLLASELLTDSLLILIFLYEDFKSHAVLNIDSILIDLSVGVIMNNKKKVLHKFSHFNQSRFDKFYKKEILKVNAIRINR